MHIKKISVSIFIGLLLSIAFYTTTFAQVGISVPKNPLNYVIKNGETAEGYFTITNTADRESTVLLYAADGRKNNSGFVSANTSKMEMIAVGKWMTLEETSVTLGPSSSPDKRKNINYTITIPKDTPPGDYVGAIAVEMITSQQKNSGQDNETATSSGVSVTSRVIQPVIISIPGQRKSVLSWTNLTHQYKDLQGHIFNLEMANEGNMALTVEVDPKITGFGISGGIDESLHQTTVQLFQEDQINYPVTWSEKPIMGFYTAHFKVTYYENDLINQEERKINTFEKKINFYVIPWYAIIAIILLIIAIASIIAYKKLQIKNLINRSTQHKVVAGETLNNLAAQTDISWKMLAKINKIKPPYELKEGTTILVPSKKDSNAK